MSATLYTDGGARGNPGPAGIGFVLTIPDHEPIQVGNYIGRATNNQAEYRALIAGLERASKENVTELHCFLDSELLVQQMRGKYRVKNAGLAPLYTHAKKIAASFTHITFSHIPREKNKKADQLVNEALDRSAS